MTVKTDQPTISDFDKWSADDDAQAFAELAQTLKVRHMIKGTTYWAITPDHSVYQLPLLMSIPDFEAFTQSDNVESIEQLKRMLTTFAGAKQAESIERQPIQVVLNLIEDYAEAITKAQGATMGK